MKEIIFDDVNFAYPGNDNLFRNISLHISTNEKSGYIIAFMGSSGVGKTTLMKLISGSLAPLRGKITTYPRNPRISYLPQHAVLFEHLSPEENVMYFERVKSHKHFFDLEYTRKIIAVLGLEDLLRKEKTVQKLSGGQKQRIALARALSIRPDFLMLDEPTKGLNGLVKQDFLKQLLTLIKEQSILAIYVTHQMAESKLIADEILYVRKKDKSTSDVILMNTNSFFKEPPLLEIAKEIAFPYSNVLKCCIEKDTVYLCDDINQDNFYLFVNKDNLGYSNQTGWKFTSEILNSQTVRLQLDSLQTLMLDSGSLGERFVYLNGEFPKYNQEGILMDILKIRRNRVLNKEEI